MRIRVVMLLLVAILGTALTVFMTPAAAPGPAPRPVAAPVSPAVAVLVRWDAARARAWSAGDVVALRGLYVRGSPAATDDVALLRRYLARGLVVVGMRRQLLSVRVVRSAASRVTLRVTDRLVGARAVSVSATARLPASAPATRRLDLRRVDGRWEMASVRLAARP